MTKRTRLRAAAAAIPLMLVLIGASPAWADHVPGYGPTTVVDNCVRTSGYCRYDRNASSGVGTNIIISHAVDTFSQGTYYDNNWKLFLGTEGKWCSNDYWLHQIHGPVSRDATTGYVPSTLVPAAWTIPLTFSVGRYEICWNNGDGGGTTAEPDVVSIVK